jgi:hypothetical protein
MTKEAVAEKPDEATFPQPTAEEMIEEATDYNEALETIQAMWQTTESGCAQRMLWLLDQHSTESKIERWEKLKQAFLERPRYWSVADCDKCHWVVGGWISEKKAAKVLESHKSRAH